MMKRIVFVLVTVGIAFASCSKDTEVKPSTEQTRKVMTGDKRDLGSWD